MLTNAELREIRERWQGATVFDRHGEADEEFTADVARLLDEIERLRQEGQSRLDLIYAQHAVILAARETLGTGPGRGHWPRYDRMVDAIKTLDDRLGQSASSEPPSAKVE